MINVYLSMNETAKNKGKSATGQHKVTVCLTDPKVAKFAKDRSRNDFDDNMSLYVRSLIRKDMGKVAA